ncbi:hypothetical protein Bca4012_065506 [Brassica carinata]|uniref:RING-type E3 ubiquitin transferase n=1 Tax=Brassica carinata TaxID=52824 RepID=A0A8X7VPC2_BRACI|nr:hypothetical protein Bca52824_017820 [Brassica carinata]
MAARYWCHMCSQAVNPIIDAKIKCPFCQSGFIEEMSEEINGGSSSLREVQNQEIDSGRRFRRAEFGVVDDEVNIAAADVDGNDISNVDNY